jgi:hypothetical protein
VELKNEIKTRKSDLKRHEAALHAQTKENKKLKSKMSEQEKAVLKFKTMGMYAFILFMY